MYNFELTMIDQVFNAANKLLVVYRCCPAETGNLPKKNVRPVGFSKEICIDSLIKRDFVKHTAVDFKIIYDTRTSDSFYSYLIGLENSNKNQVDMHTINVCDNEKSYKYSLEYACRELNKEGSPYKYVYFVEDDYCHSPKWLANLADGFILIKEELTKLGISSGNGFVSLYDHPDRYDRDDDLTYLDEKLTTGVFSHWRTAESTTCTWAATKSMFNKVYSTALALGIQDREFFRTIYKTYGSRLVTPIPGASTHMHYPFLSPFFNTLE